MKTILCLIFLVTIFCVKRAMPKQLPNREFSAAAPLNPEWDGRFNGCLLPFQYVNPYYHELTARTCVNILGFNLNRIPTTSVEYQIGCDCIFPFAMNYKGQCIQEDECNEREAFGEQAIIQNQQNKNVELTTAATGAAAKTEQQLQQQPQSQVQPQPQPQAQPQQQQTQRINSKMQQNQAQMSDYHAISTNSAQSKY